LPDHRAEPCLADRAEAWRCGSPRDTAHGPESRTGHRTSEYGLPAGPAEKLVGK
jgi:hypothetical protein